MSTSFTDTFGGSAISPAQPSYQAVALTASTQFYWPVFSAGNPNVISRFMNVTASSNGLNLIMPDATLASVGQDTVIYNSGSHAFNVVNYATGAIATIQPGTAWYVELIDNSTQAGTWLVLQFGAGSSSTQASALAGAGLSAMAGVLNLNLVATTVGTNFIITSGSLSLLYVWNGGAGTCTLPAAASVGDGFFYMLANEGSGNVTVTPNGADTIDGEPTSVFSPSQSAFVVSTGSSWVTVGKGTQTNFAFTLLNLNVAGSSDVTLTSVQAQNVIQNYTGVLTGNINVIVPATVQLYIVDNATTGAFSLKVKTASGTGIIVPQSSTSILYCDGTNVLSAFSFVPSGSTFSGGSVTSPGINWSGNTNTGFYQPTSNQVGVATAGLASWVFAAQASAVNSFESTAAATGVSPILQVLGSDGNIGLKVLTKGTGALDVFTGSGRQFQVQDSGGSAVNYVGVTGSITTVAPVIGALGSDTNISLGLVPKGTGFVIGSGTSGLIVPTGTTGQRLGTTNGTIRMNSSVPQLEAYVGGWSTIMLGANNLSDLQSAATARTNLGVAPGAGLQQTGSTLIWDFTTEAAVASATTCDIGAATSNVVDITGTTTITSLGNSASTANPIYFVRFTGALILTYNSSTLIIPGSANVTTAAGDCMIAKFEGTSHWRVIGYFPASGGAIIPTGVTAFSGDGALLSNSSSTGSVTAALTAITGGVVWGRATGTSGAPGYTATPVLGRNTAVAGTLGLANGGASGTTVTLQNPSSTSAYNFNFPTGAGSTGQIFQSGGGGSTANTWSTATYPASTTVSQILYSSSANVIAGLATANSGLLVTSGSGVPSISTAIPNGVTATTQSAADNSTKVATTAYADTGDTSSLKKASNLSDLASIATSLTNLGFSTTTGASGSVTLPGGVIIKWGSVAGSIATIPVTFGTAYPNACWSAVITPVGPSGGSPVYLSGTVSTSGFSIVNASASVNPIYWIAIGN